MAPENFRAQMRWLAEHGWHTVGTRELEDFLAGKPLPMRSVMLTFDDGYLDNFVHAFPVLREYGLKAVIFVITGLIGEGNARPEATCPDHKTCKRLIDEGRADEVMLRWSEVEAMRAAGSFEFHSHTHSHTRWDRIETDATLRCARLAADLAASRAMLHERLGAASSHLCWPQGHFDADYLRVAQAAGFTHCYTTRPGTCTADTHAHAIPRLVVKDRGAGWFGRRLWLYRQPALTQAYLSLQGKAAWRSV
jgi:peptidoglycan/xylan/chitin deacetylase (PgdA/CDA1 family)